MTPFIGFTSSSLAAGEPLVVGDEITCPTCNGKHVLLDSNPPGVLLSYRCLGKTYLAAIKGRNVMERRADFSGAL